MRALIRLISAAILASAALPAQAGPSVFLNGVNIDGVTNQKFDSCTVTIDEKGDVHIQAKGYAVSGPAQPVNPPPPPPPPPVATQAHPDDSANQPIPATITKRYFLVTEQSQRDGTQFDIAVFINAKWIRELKSNEDQIVTEVTKYLRPGPNKVVLAATKHVEGDRHSFSPQVTFKVIIGSGNSGGDNVMIDNPLVQMTRTAAENESVTEEYSLFAK